MNLVKMAYIISMFILIMLTSAIIYLCYLFYPNLKSIYDWIFPVLGMLLLTFWMMFITRRYNSQKIKTTTIRNNSILKILTDKVPKGKYTKICPKCGSSNVSFYGGNVVHDFCKDCGFGHDITPFSESLDVFPEIEGTGTRQLDKVSKYENND